MNDRQFVMSELAKRGMTQTELAKRLGTTQSAFSHKLSRNALTLEDCKKIAEILGLQFQFGFINNNNEQVVRETL